MALNLCILCWWCFFLSSSSTFTNVHEHICTHCNLHCGVHVVVLVEVVCVYMFGLVWQGFVSNCAYTLCMVFVVAVVVVCIYFVCVSIAFGVGVALCIIMWR